MNQEMKRAEEELQEALEKRILAGQKEAVRELKTLLRFTPEFGFRDEVPLALNWNPEQEAEERELLNSGKVPFFSETYLYNLLGKGDARTILAILGSLARALGARDGLCGIEELVQEDEKGEES